MALINCPTCGKKVSDTVKVCIHCKNPLIQPEPTPKVEKEIKKDYEYEYRFLDKGSCEGLEHEFLSHNPEAMKWRRKQLDAKSTGKLAGSCFACSFAVVLVILILIKLINSGIKGTAEKLFIALLISVGVLFFTGIALLIFRIVSSIIYSTSVKRLIYLKMYKAWLRENGVKYTVTFDSEAETLKFKNIDLNRDKL